MTSQNLPPEKLLLTAEEAAHVLSIGRTKVFDLIARAEIESICIGTSRRIPSDALADYVRRLRSGHAGAA